MLQTTDVKQLLGGKIVKQTDKSSPFSFLLLDSQKKKVPLNEETAEIVLYTSKGKYWETSSKVTDGIVNFQMPGNLSVDNYKLEISVSGFVFPSKEDFIIKVVQGFKELPDKETAENIKKTTEEFVREEAEKAVRELGKTELKGEKGETGKTGAPGKSITITNTTKQGKDNIITFSDETQITVKDGADGVDGKDAKVDAASIAKLSKSDKDIIRKEINAPSKDEVVLKEVGKGLSDNNFDNQYKQKLDNLDQTFKDLVVDDLAIGGRDKALSAEQGKVLFNTIAKYHPDAAPPKVMTAVIDQANSNPLTCITYEDDAKMMEKGSPEWDDFFQSQLVLFKDGKEVRELEDSELNNLKPEDGDVMVRFPRKGLRIKTVGEKVYVSMTDNIDDPDFKYYAHTRGNQRKYNFYLGAYLGYEESGKLRSITGKAPTGSKTIGSFRTIAQANGAGYEQLAFYQWTFLQAMYVLKYGNLDSQTALGKGNTSGNDYNKATGETNGKGVDFGSTSSTTKVRFQWVEDFFGTKFQWCDGGQTNNNKIWISNDNFNDTGNGYKSYEGYDVYEQNRIKSVIGDSERGFIPKSDNGSSSTYYCDYGFIKLADNRIIRVGGGTGRGANAGAFAFDAVHSASDSPSYIGARLMFL